MLARIRRNWTTCTRQVGEWNGKLSLFGKQLAVSYKTKHAVTNGPAIVPLGVNPREVKTCIHVNPQTNAALFTIAPSCKRPGYALQKGNGWTHCGSSTPQNIKLLSNEKKPTTDADNDLDKSPGNLDEWEKLSLQGYIRYDPIYVTFVQWQNYTGKRRVGVGVKQ